MVILRRRRVPVFPLLALGLDVIVSVLLAFGNTRYRSTFEVALALLAAVTIDAALDPAGALGPALVPDRNDDASDDAASDDAGPESVTRILATPSSGVIFLF